MKRRLTTGILGAWISLVSTAAFAVVLVPPGHLVGSRLTPTSLGIVALSGWSSIEGGMKLAWNITFDGTNWNYTYTFTGESGGRINKSVSHWIIEVSPFITAANVNSYIFDSNFTLVGPKLWKADANSPNNSGGGPEGNANLPADLYGIKLDTSLSTYTFKSSQAPMWGDFFAKDGSGDGGPTTTAWNAGIGTDPTGATTIFTPWIAVPDTVQSENCADSVDNDGDKLADCADPDCNAAACNDGAFCTVGDTCSAGVCSGTLRNCSDSISCTTDTCNEQTDQCVRTPNNATCSDGQFCNGIETCNATLGCQAGGNPCTTLFCDESSDVCTGCLNHVDCDDGQYCNGVEICSSGTCQPGTPPNCSDSVSCTTDTCNETTDQCVHTTTNAACSDGQFCNGTETCHATLGCQAGTPVNCSDSISCTRDSCNETTDQCVHTANHAACSDGEFCNGAETCNASVGCQAGSDPCTVLLCDEIGDMCTGCLDDAECDDGLYCNGVETCASGVCASGSPPDCSPLDSACLVGTCQESTDSCVSASANEGSPCDDGDPCTPDDLCITGTCTPAGTVCGNNTIEGACGEDCDPPSTLGGDPQCGTQCHLTPPACGDGNVAGGEKCDPPASLGGGTSCNDDCTLSLCGDAIVGAGEQCDPPSPEICDNTLDDDADNLFDCEDPDCPRPAGMICVSDCSTQLYQCKAIREDPAVIKFYPQPKLDIVKIHGRVEIDPTQPGPCDVGFRFMIKNEKAIVFLGEIPPEEMVPSSFGRCFYKNRDAKNTGGFFRIGLTPRTYDGVPYLTFRIRAFGDPLTGPMLDLEETATESLMTTMVYGMQDMAILTADWTKQKRGWILRLSDF